MTAHRVLVATLSLILLPWWLAAPASSGYGAAPPPPSSRTETVIVTMRGAPALSADAPRARSSQLQTQHADLLGTARAAGIEVVKEASYDTALNGMALRVSADQVAALRTLPGVTGVYPDAEFHATLTDAVPHVHAPDVWSRLDDSGREVKGTGQTVAVIDTGIDYRHPDLGGCLGRGCRVIRGRDFVNGDNDPMDDNFHGTHVAGIIGASGASGADSVTGVAPDVRFLAYKVLNRNGDGQLADILAAIDAATDPFNLDRPRVINMSLGNDTGDGTDLLSQAVQNASDAGYVVVVAAGNTGPSDESMGAPAAAPGALTVGASTTGVVTPEASVVAPRPYDPKASRLGFSANPQARTTRLDLVDVGRGTPEDYAATDVTGKIVLVDSGDSPYAWFQSGIAAEQHGAAAAFIVQADPEEPSQRAVQPDDWATGSQISGDDGRLDSLVAMQVSPATATDLRGMLAQAPTAISINAVDATDQIPAFSSRGPSGIFGGKPDLVAPGVEIRSTVPTEMFGAPYGRVSGTSMAAPMVAGAAALLRQLRPRWDSERIAAALTASAHRLPGPGPLAQGAGLLDVAAAADNTVTSEPRIATLGLADATRAKVSDSTTITLTNNGTATRVFRFGLTKATGKSANVTVTPSNVRLLAGERATVTVQVTTPRPEGDLDVTGWLSADVDGDGRDDLSIPYSMSVRPLDLFATPDPSVGDSEVFVRAPAELASGPRLEVTGPQKFRRTVTARLDHGYWWRAKIPTGPAGIYQVHATSRVTAPYGGAGVSGDTTLEVLAKQSGGAKWQPLGPYSSGGEIASSPAGGKRMLVASEETASVFDSSNGGQTWRQRSNLPIAGGSGFGAQPLLEADPTRIGRYYLGIDAGQADPTYLGALFVTDDSGADWQRLPYPDDRVFDLAVGANGRTLAVVSDDAFYISSDAGRTWRTLWGDWSFATDVAIDGDRAYLATADGVWAYDDIDGDLSGPTQVLTADYIDAVTAGDGHVFAWSGWSGEPIVESADAGATWHDAYLPTKDFLIGRALKIVDGDVWATSNGGVWIGKDLGQHWEAATMPQAGLVVGDVEPIGDRTVLSSDGGLFASGDGAASYERIGVQGTDAVDVALTRGSTGQAQLVAGTQWDTYTTRLQGDGTPPSPDWGSSPKEGQFGAQTYFVATVPNDPSVVYKVSDEGFGVFGLYRSVDGGTTWQLVKKLQQLPTSLLVHPADPDSIYIGFAYWDLSQGLFISHDAGATWRREPMDRPPLALAGDPKDPTRIYAGDERGFYVSANAGRSFQRLHPIPTSGIAVDPAQPSRLVFGGSEIHTSSDRGLTANLAAGPDVAMQISDLAFGPQRQVYAATRSYYDQGLLVGGRGVLVSTNNGQKFAPSNAGLGRLDARSLAIGGGRIYVGLGGGGVYTMRP